MNGQPGTVYMLHFTKLRPLNGNWTPGEAA
jgi:hypothetical protein